MKPSFALSLSPDGISLLHRAAGGWRLVGSVALDTSDLGAALAGLRAKAVQLAPGKIFCKLIVPNSQIRYITLETGPVDADARMDLALAALDGATPYPVDELAFDLSEDGPLTHVAAVAIETLEEAESFADSHGFAPTSFVAAPGDQAFLGEPFFGTTRSIRGTDVEPDGIAVVNIGPAEIPASQPDPEPAPSIDDISESTDTEAQFSHGAPDQPIETDLVDLSIPSDEPPIAAPAFSSRRHKPSNGAPVLQGATRTPPAAGSPIVASDPVPSQDADSAPPEPTEMAIRAPTAEAVDPPEGVSSDPFLSIPPEQIPTPTVTGPDRDPIPAAPQPSGNDTAFTSRRQPETAPEKSNPPRKATRNQPSPAKSAKPGKLGNSPFGSREPMDVGGKPRFLGPILVAALLLFMAAVAAWAIYSKTTWLSFDRDTSAEDAISAPSPVEEIVPPKPPDADPSLAVPKIEATPDQPLEIIVPQVSALPENLTDRATSPVATAPLAETLTGPDIAVLGALREPTRTDLDVEAISDGVENGPQTPTVTEPSQAAQYAAVGIWQRVPEVPKLPAVISLDDLYVASIDNTDLSQDAVALPLPDTLTTDEALNSITSPATAGSAFDLDERGLVRATPEGTMNPDGVMVYLGRPSRVPPPTPSRPDPEAEAEVSEQQAVLARIRPRARPDDLVERAERAQLGGLSLAELGQKRPRSRPASSRPANEDSLPTTEQAIATSTVPRSRPANFANLVDRAQRNTNNNVPASASASTAGILNQPSSVAPATVTPSIPTSASVARQATMENSINLRKVNLIGVYGKPSNRRALVRLSSGRYKKVKVGDRIDGGQVVAIGDAELRYQKGGRNVTLKIPNG
ncbi:hypothetical protein DL239_18270 [Sedimentitalea sp. CY04]|uniref:Type IV pilus biogenesis protein PilP n=1 Tax=Parasedimentitalea denitrificans TaxID=2211118 RepID=A0ABX0WBT5_9RHOB|nr:hypothetical protein [Sedimentitalea sp. CY04]NIZ62916.1 hypothetical protein [Sedimentitalea sp. CY04]